MLTPWLYIYLVVYYIQLAWVVVYYLIVGSPEPQRGNFNKSHALFFNNLHHGICGGKNKITMEENKNQTDVQKEQQQQTNEMENEVHNNNQTEKEYVDVKVLKIINGINWFSLIGLLTLINLVLGLTTIPIAFIYGLCSTQILDGFGYKWISIPYAILISIYFIILRQHIAKTCNHKIYLCGIIILAIDICTLLLLATFSVINDDPMVIIFFFFMCYALFKLCRGYKNLRSYKKENNIPEVSNKLTFISGLFFIITESLILIICILLLFA